MDMIVVLVLSASNVTESFWRWLCIRDVVQGAVPHQKRQHRLSGRQSAPITD